MEEQRQRSAIQQELLAEVAAGHPLSGISSEVIARSEASDDALVRVEDGRWALVHLTWRQAAEAPPWPIAKWVPSLIRRGSGSSFMSAIVFGYQKCV
jgi:hypothetical protein